MTPPWLAAWSGALNLTYGVPCGAIFGHAKGRGLILLSMMGLAS